MNKTFVNLHNSKALDFVNKYKNIVYSYLLADPSKKNFNHIFTIPVSQRSDANGWSNFRFDFQEKVGALQKINVRVETNVFQNNLIIQSTKIGHLQKSDLIIFPDETGDGVYLSFLDNWGNRNWLTDKKYFRRETKYWPTGEKTYNFYNLRNLLANGQIIQLLPNEIDNKIVVVSNLDFLLPDRNTKNDTRVWKDYIDYDIDTSHITQVQFDRKQANTVYWCTSAERYTKNFGSTTKVSIYLESISTKDYKAIYQQLLRAYKKTINDGKAYSFKIPVNPELKNKITFDQSMLDENDNITIYVSDNPEFDVIENKVEAIDRYSYQRVYQWLRKHPGSLDFPSKWSDNDKKIAEYLLASNPKLK